MNRYMNLVAEMTRKRISRLNIANVLGQTRGTVGLKIKGEYSFTLDEAKTIHSELFKDCDFVYLFQRENEDDIRIYRERRRHERRLRETGSDHQQEDQG